MIWTGIDCFFFFICIYCCWKWSTPIDWMLFVVHSIWSAISLVLQQHFTLAHAFSKLYISTCLLRDRQSEKKKVCERAREIEKRRKMRISERFCAVVDEITLYIFSTTQTHSNNAQRMNIVYICDEKRKKLCWKYTQRKIRRKSAQTSLMMLDLVRWKCMCAVAWSFVGRRCVFLETKKKKIYSM